jgi:hypothetical protein
MVLWEITYGSSDEYRTISVDGTTGAVLAMLSVWAENRQLPSITAMDGYPMAEAKAEEWDPGAVLVKIDTNSVCVPHQTSLSQDGKSPVWTYWFAIANPSNAQESKRSFYVAVCGGELAGFEEGYPGETHKVQGAAEDWIIDSLQAVEIAEQNGGQQARARNLSMIIASLFLVRPANGPAASKNVTWLISYQDLDTFPVEAFSVFIDGTTGQLIGTQ